MSRETVPGEAALNGESRPHQSGRRPAGAASPTAETINWTALFRSNDVQSNLSSHWTVDLWRAFRRFIPPGARVLEIGTGTGRLACLAARDRGAASVAIDISWEALQIAGQTAAYVGVAPGFVCADGLLTPFADNTFDVVLSSGVIEHFEDRIDAVVHEHARVCRPGGTVLISTPNLLNLPLTLHKWRAGSRFHAYPERSFTAWSLGRLVRRHGLQPRASTGFSPSASIEWYFLPTKRFRVLDKVIRSDRALALTGYQVLVAAEKRRP